MKHSTSSTHFSGIPIDTNTLAGQWMTFSHMANHYRKLLNVKPRVDTGLVQNNFPSSAVMMQSLQSSKSQKKSSNKRQTLSSNNNSSNNNFQLYQQQNRKNSQLFSSHPDHLNMPMKASCKEITSKSTLKSKNKHNPSCQLQPQYSSDYQVVFGPSSIRSSTDAFLSDETESTTSNDNKPPSEVQAPIGVTEKIRRFLSHIHQLDLTSPSTSSGKKRGRSKAVTVPSTAISNSNGLSVKGNKANSSVALTNPSSTSNADIRLSRHSKCFLPYEPEQSPRKSPRKSPKLSSKSIGRNSGEKSLSSAISSLNRKQEKAKLGAESQKSSNCDQLYFQSSELGRNRHTGSSMDIHSMVPEKDGSGKKSGKSRRRAGSIASIGTICGSEELTAEDFPMSIKDICSTLESGLLGDDDLNDLLFSRTMDDNLYLRKHKKSSPNNHNHYDTSYSQSHRSLPKSNSIASLVPIGSRIGSGDAAIKNSRNKGDSGVGSSVQANGNNKDSSRDSAYGFSSGESRITTRESTPEKKCLNGLGEKSHKHHRSHRDIDLEKPSKDRFDREVGASLSSEKRFSSKALKDHRHLRSSRKDDSPSGINAKSSSSANSLRRQDSSETYITLLAELTQDIVSQGIYTNKGLKTVFKSYMDEHKNLNQDKLADMLERLRMDLGIPKDDTLDRLEFGYGSISNTTSTTYFYQCQSSDDKLSTESLSGLKPPTHHPSTESLQSDSPSPTTIIPTALRDTITPAPTTTTGFSSSPNTSSNRSTTTTEEGSGDIPSDYDNYKNHEEDIGIVKDDDDELSLSETELTQALKFAGLDDGEMEELVGILNS